MVNRAWAIKLGSGGVCIPFCERRKIVGVGWKAVDSQILTKGTRDDLAEHLSELYKSDNNRTVGASTGQLFRFARECTIGDYVLYYDPPKKHVTVCRVTSDVKRRDFDVKDETDIWFYREVEYPCGPIPILDFYGPLKGSLLGPRMSFWDLWSFDEVDLISQGKHPSLVAAPDPAVEEAYRKLKELVLRRAEDLNDKDWEFLVADYFKAQGAHIDERKIGGSQPIIDAEARFQHGELGEVVWRIQVKRYQGRKVDWPEIESDFRNIGEEARFCYVSAYGFTDGARAKADDAGIRLMEAADFTRFMLSGKIRDSLKKKLKLPALG